MSDQANHYRTLALKARADADAASLPNVRQSHLRSAQRFDEIVSGFETVAKAKTRNEEAKASMAS